MKQYKVKEGVERVNGKRVPPDRTVTLSDEQARYEFDQGKLEAPAEKPHRKPKEE